MAAGRQRFAQRRKALGFSQESLADAVGTDRTTVGRWERGQTQPYPHLRRRLCQALRVTAEELDDLLTCDDQIRDTGPNLAQAGVTRIVAAPEPTGARDDMNRRELLHLFSLAGTAIALPPTTRAAAGTTTPDLLGGPAEPGNIEQYAELNSHLWRVFGLATNKQHVSTLVQEQLAVLIDQMDHAPTLAAHRRLCELTSELLQLAGEIFFDHDRYTDAAHSYALAASAAREAVSYDRWACALTRQAFVSIYDQRHGHAASVLNAASRIAHRGDSQLATRHWVAAVQAQTAAELGDPDGCQHGLDTTNQVLHLAGPVNPGGWLRFDGRRLDEQQGTCYLTLGLTDSAAAALARALHTTVSPRRRGSLLTDLATLGIQQRNPDQVISQGHDALDLAEQTRSAGYIGRKLHTLQAKLTPLLADRRVAQLDDRITDFVTHSKARREGTDERL